MDAPTEARGGPLLRLVRGTGRRLLALPRSLSWLLAAAWMVLIWKLSAIRGDEMQRLHDGPSYLLDLGHAGVFGLLALWLSVLLPRVDGWVTTRRGMHVAVVAAAALYGVIDEWHQSFVPGRHPTIFDLVTDTIGAVCVMWVIAYAGSAGASERGLRLRLGVGLLACLAAAGLSTTVHSAHPAPLWW